MAIKWRELLSTLGVPWVERSPNISKGEIGLRCPWCGNADPSQHLALDETTGYYQCRRSAGHGGKSPFWLLRGLGVRRDLAELVALYGGPDIVRDRPDPVPATVFAKRWDDFAPAADDDEACDYLKRRGFWHPQRTARIFDLRVGQGKYAGRLWFPFRYGAAVAGFTGRSMRNREPRYYTEAAGTYLYLPELPYDTDRTLILVEGPIDALRLADAINGRYDLALAALCGLTITPDKRTHLAALAGALSHFFVALDSTVEPIIVNRLMAHLNTFQFRHITVERLDLPAGVDDPGDMTGEQIETWLLQTGVTQLTN